MKQMNIPLYNAGKLAKTLSPYADGENNMALEFKWLIRNEVILQRIEGEMSIDDLRSMAMTLIDMVEQSKRPLVHHIVDTRLMTQMPLNVREMSQNLFEPLRHPRYGWAIIIGKHDPVTKSVLSMALQINKIRYRFVPDPIDAARVIQEQDSAISPIAIDELMAFCGQVAENN